MGLLLFSNSSNIMLNRDIYNGSFFLLSFYALQVLYDTPALDKNRILCSLRYLLILYMCCFHISFDAAELVRME